MEMYFKRYSTDNFGHHRSLENTIFLVFIIFNLLFYINQNPNQIKLILILLYIVFCIIIGVYDFLHKLPRHFLFNRSTKSFVAYISYITIIFVYSDMLIPFTFLKFIYLMLSVILLFILYIGIRFMLKFLAPKSYEKIDHFLKHIEDDIKKSNNSNSKTKKTKKKK